MEPANRNAAPGPSDNHGRYFWNRWHQGPPGDQLCEAVMSKLTVRYKEFRPLRRDTLVGFAIISIVEPKLEIPDVAIHQKGDSRWAQLAAKPQTKDGTLVKDAISGKVQHVTILEFADRAVREAFSQAVIRAVLEHAPHVFD
jgi:hypothetical protein